LECPISFSKTEFMWDRVQSRMGTSVPPPYSLSVLTWKNRLMSIVNRVQVRSVGELFASESSEFDAEKINWLQIQGVIESCTDILPTSYWLHVELGKNI
jgi:hypothetical protein